MFIERTSVGLDVHARSVRAAVIDTETGELVERTVSPVTDQVVAFVEEVAAGHGPVRVTYEAGPTGFELHRLVTSLRVDCAVVAPSLIPKRAGDRVKTDKRDARRLAVLHEAGLLTPIRVPTPREVINYNIILTMCSYHSLRN